MLVTVMFVVSSFVTAITTTFRSMFQSKMVFGTIFTVHAIFLLAIYSIQVGSAGSQDSCQHLDHAGTICKTSGAISYYDDTGFGNHFSLVPIEATFGFILSWILAQYASETSVGKHLGRQQRSDRL